MKQPGEIDIIKTRDTREISNLAFHYISKNGSAILLPIISISIPLIIISEICAIAIVQGFNPFNRLIWLKKSLDSRSFLMVVLLFIIYVIGLALYNYFINNCLLKSERKTYNETEVKTSSLIRVFRNYFINFSILYIIFYILSNVLEYFYFQMMSDFDPGTISGVFGYIWLLLLNKLPWLIIMPPVFFFCFAAGYLSYRNDIGSSDALSKIWALVKEKPQKVWLNSVKVSGIYFGVILTLKIFLWYLRGLGGLFTEIPIVFFSLLSIIEIAMILIAMIHLHVSMVLLYGSFEDEMHGHFIKRKVDEISN